jgi:hypothetical protein
MWTAASVLVCALSVLGRSAASMPPIELLEVAPPEVSAGAEAFVLRTPPTIYLMASSAAFQEAFARGRCSDSPEMKKLASVLAHENAHLRHGADEKAAYEHQLLTLVRLGVGPGSSIYRQVHLSMTRVLAVHKRNRTQLAQARSRAEHEGALLLHRGNGLHQLGERRHSTVPPNVGIHAQLQRLD